MLTEAEKKWLEERKQLNYPAACTRFNPTKSNRTNGDCHPICGLDYNWRDWECVLRPGKNDYKDAAEFEARVANRLARLMYLTPCVAGGCTEHTLHCTVCRLKYARLAVEEEMK